MRKGKRITAVLLTMAMVIGSFATDPYVAEAKSKKAVKSVSISNVDSKTLVLKKGEKFKLKTKVKVTGGASKYHINHLNLRLCLYLLKAY